MPTIDPKSVPEEISEEISGIGQTYIQDCHHSGMIHFQNGDFPAAMRDFTACLRMSPGDSVFLGNAGIVLNSMGKTDDALKFLIRSIASSPANLSAWQGLCKITREAGLTSECQKYALQALCIFPEDRDLLRVMSHTRFDAGSPEESILFLERAVYANPGSSEDMHNLGVLYKVIGLPGKAFLNYRAVLKACFDPGTAVKSALLLPVIPESVEDIAFWRERLVQELKQLQGRGITLNDPYETIGTTNFLLAYHGLNDREIQSACARFFITATPGLDADLRPLRRKSRDERIRVSFVSPHFRTHTISVLNRGFIEHLARDKFRVSVIHTGKPDAMTALLAGHADEFIQARGGLAQLRASILGTEPDIVYYADIGMDALTYFSAFSRLAPVQCLTWGHPSTTGIPNLDYFLSSVDLEPEDATRHYSETLIRFRTLNTCYHRIPAPKNPLGRADFGLPQDRRLYVCPQALFKLHPDFDTALCEIARMDNSALFVFIKGEKPTWTDLLLKRLKTRFPHLAGKVAFLPRLGREEFLSLQIAADVVLDSFYFGGGSTSFESFAMSAPVVTLKCPFMRGRITYAQYAKMGFTDLVAEDIFGYVRTAVSLACDAEKNMHYRKLIAQRKHALFEDMAPVRELEIFFESAHKAAQKGCKLPAGIYPEA